MQQLATAPRWITRLAVLATGALGLALVGRAAAVYRGGDPLAFGLVLLIGFGLALGALELFGRATRADRLLREIAALPRPATSAAVEQSSPPLRAMLSARMAGLALPAAPASFASYLVGLLVMIGLLGTFLGLFETLRGAREALTLSGDVDALRGSLAAPMQGLSRAFGTSAAGVSASAMLGLGAVFVRRAELSVMAAIQAYASGPLAALTVSGRQLAALEALARQGEALPGAAAALRDATSRLERLEERLATAQIEGARETAAVFGKAAAEIRADLAAGLSQATGAAADAVRPILAHAVERAGTLAGDSLRSLERQLDGEARARREAEAAATARLEDQAERFDVLLGALDTTTRRVGESALEQADLVASLAEAAASAAAERDARAEGRAEGRASALAEAVRALLVEQAARLSAFEERLEASRIEAADALAERLGAHAHGLGQSLDRLDEAAAARLDRMEGTAAERLARLDRESTARRSELEVESAARIEGQAARLIAVMREAIERLEQAQAARAAEAAARATDLDAATAAHLAALGEALAGPLTAAARAAQAAPEAAAKLVEAASERLSARADADAARDARLDALLGALDTTTRQVGESAREQADRIASLAEAAASAAAERDARAEARVTGLAAGAHELFAEQAASMSAFEQRLEHARGEVAEALAERLSAHARGLGESLEATAAVVREASELLRAGGAEMTAVAEMFTGAVDRYREASDRWLTNLGAIEDAIERKEHGEAADLLGAYLDQTREVFDHSLQFQRELFSELRALKGTAGKDRTS